jgi:hypothetical protein
MVLWWKRSSDKREPTSSENPYRKLAPEIFDRGAKVNQHADELRRVANKQLRGADVLTALLTALGAEIADGALRRNPTFSPDQVQHVIDQVLDAVCPGVREAAYRTANLEPSGPFEEESLSPEQFNALTMRIINEAIKNNTPVDDALSATTKAVGVMISTLAARGTPIEDLVSFCQNAVAEFAREASAFTQQNLKR